MAGKPIIVSLDCNRVDLRDWVPEDPTDVSLGMVLELGWEGEKGTTLFYFLVATPEGLKRIKPIAPVNPVVSYRALIVMTSFSMSEMESAVRRIIDAAPQDDMNKCWEWLTRYFQWEYENTAPIDA